jgi:hypothetical protein
MFLEKIGYILKIIKQQRREDSSSAEFSLLQKYSYTMN